MKILIIGSGPAGSDAARLAALAGHQITLFEKGAIGGVCLNEGCIPTKTLLDDAYHLRKVAQLNQSEPFLSAPALIHHKEEVINDLQTTLIQTLKSNKVELIESEVKFLNDTHVVDASGNEYTGDHIVIACGAKPIPIDLPYPHIDEFYTSKTILNAAFTQKKRLIIIGGGIIGCEVASYLAMMGHSVHILELAPSLLRSTPKDLVNGLLRDFKQNGIEITTSAQIQMIKKDEFGYHFQLDAKEIQCDEVVLAVGRRPSLDGLGLENTSIQIENGHIKVNELYQTSCPHIYALGDVNGSIQLAHNASHQAHVYVNQLNHKELNIKPSLPNVIYTPLQAAWVGLSEDDAKAMSNITTYRATLSSNAKQRIKLGTRGSLKMLIDEQYHLMGAEILSADAGELIAYCSTWIDLKVDLRYLKYAIFPHPSLSESFMLILHQLPDVI